MEHNLITNVSDTALWIAAFRADETERKDALFNDKLAKKLAGEKGYEILRATPHKEAMAFNLVLRTISIDKLVQLAIKKNIDAVINLGAGMDTRPYRLSLPPDLLWIEVDMPELIEYKNAKTRDVTPNCKLERKSCDLANSSEREKLFRNLGAECKRALVITEGVIPYLSPDEASALSRSIYSISAFKYWVMEYAQGKLATHRQSKDLEKKILQKAPIRFNQADPISFFVRDGWRVEENLYILDEADRVGRKFPPMFPWNLLIRFSTKVREMANKTYGYVMFAR